MANEDHLAVLRQGVAAWNEWRDAHPDIHPDLRGANLIKAYLSGANLSSAYLSGANLIKANLISAYLREANLIKANLREANLINANLIKADLSGADLSGADLRGADLRGADLRGANLSGANLRQADLSGADLRGANFSEANLSETDLSDVNFSETDLSDVNFSETDLTEANLREADLSGADLFGADLRWADLSGANLCEADLSGANLREADLSGANLHEAVLDETAFANVDLSTTKGLDTCKHLGPSILDLRTLQQSGRLPLAFLRGCGLPDRLIDYLPSLLEEAIQYYSCFISYSSKDDAFAKRLYADLQNNGVRCWFAPHDLPIGAKTRDAIDEAIRLRDKVLLILSKNAIASDWVEAEVTKAFAEESRRKQPMLFPVRIDNTVLKTGEAWASTLRDQRNIGDFRKWKEHDAYQQAFNRVLRDLKAVPG